MLVEFDDDDDEDEDDDDDEGHGEDDDDEAVRGLELDLWDEDRYPLLPDFDSNILLNVLKRILRVYIREVQSEFLMVFWLFSVSYSCSRISKVVWSNPLDIHPAQQ
jgi:hypothetical protein